MCYEFTQGKKKKNLKSNVIFLIFSVLFEIIKPGPEQPPKEQVCVSGQSFSCRLPDLFGEASGFPRIQAHGSSSRLAHGAPLLPSASCELCTHLSSWKYYGFVPGRAEGEERIINILSWEQPSSRCNLPVVFQQLTQQGRCCTQQ